MVPRVDLIGVINHPQCGLAVNLFGIKSIAAEFLSGLVWISTEMQKRLGILGIDVLTRNGSTAVFLDRTKEELIKLGGDNSHIPASVVIGIRLPVVGLHKGCVARLAGMGGVHGVIGYQKYRINKGFIPLVILYYRPVGRPCSVGMACHPDAGSIYIRQIHH